MDPTQLPISGWQIKKDVAYIQNGTLFSYERGEYPAIFNNMDGALAHYESERDKYCIVPLICGI